MADSNITVSGLTVSSGIGHNFAQWTFTDPHSDDLLSLSLDAVELWASETNDRTAASKIGEGRDSAGHFALTAGDTWYYWIKPRNRSGFYGDWHPSGTSDGVEATVFSDNSAWEDYTPTISSSSGALVSASATGRYKRRGKSVIVIVSWSIDDAGTGFGALKFTLPFPIDVAAPLFSGVGYESQSDDILIVQATSSGGVMAKYDGATVIASSASGVAQIEYEPES